MRPAMGIVKYVWLGCAFLTVACGPPVPQPEVMPVSEFTFEQGAFEPLINRARRDAGLGPLTGSPRLNIAAQVHANDMSESAFFSHTGSNGGSVGQRVAATGYGHCWVSENISWNRKTEAEAFARWMASPGHRRNMMSSQPTEYGLAVAPGLYRVLVLARPGC